MAKRTISTNEPAKYINPLTDFGFKRIFGTEANKDLLVNFLESVLSIEGGIRKLRYDNPEHQGRLEIDRKAIFDLYCITGKGEHILIEVQNVRQDYYKDRALYYASFPIQKQGVKKREWDFKLTPVYSVNILNFHFENPDDAKRHFHYVQLIDRDTQRVFYDKLTFVFMELPLFTKTIDELQSDFDKWLYVLKHLSELQDLPEPLRSRVFRKLFHIAEITQMSPKERDSYDQSLKEYRDMYLMENALKKKDSVLKRKDALIRKHEAALKKQGADLEKKDADLKKKDAHLRNSARILLDAGIDMQKICESTGLSIAEIEKIRKVTK